MPEDKEKILEQISVHAAIIADLYKKLEVPPKMKKSRGFTPEMMAKYQARLRKSMYKK